MIFLFTDYGLNGPYLGQVNTVFAQSSPEQRVINLLADAPRNNPKASAYLLASLVDTIPPGAIVFSVIDPGVGSNVDRPVILIADQRTYVGPDNGLFDIVIKRSSQIRLNQIDWRPESLSISFHGRDLYAPVCAMLANQQQVEATPLPHQDARHWPDEINEIIYFDSFGNAMTGLSASHVDTAKVININGYAINHADTFASVTTGQAFWYSNSNGLLEIAVNQGSAKTMLNLEIGVAFSIDDSE